jgi:threonine synthase
VPYYSTRNRSVRVNLRQALLGSLPADGGLYMPERIDPLPPGFFETAPAKSFQEIAWAMANSLFRGDPGEDTLQRIVAEAFDFRVPLVKLADRLYALELFHGPTLAFKDFAARFMARLMASVAAGEDRELHILVATSGDTGSAVAHGFHNVGGIRVHILFPSGRVSPIQRAQLTTMGGNISALEVAGTFDDCQRMVKEAFLDSTIGARMMMSSANSINVARLIPQSFYYGWAWAQLEDHARPAVISVPSGNLGNLTAGLIAKRMGLPVRCFVAATNVNDALPRYLMTGSYSTRPAVTTLSNAMDVSDPSNFARILDLYDGDRSRLCADIKGFGFGDDQTLAAIRELYGRYHYVADPHGAVGYLGMKSYLESMDNSVSGIFLETAHPAKFPEILRQAAGLTLPTPPHIRELQDKESRAIRIKNDFEELKEYLLSC